MANHTETLKDYYEKWNESKGGSVDDWMELFDDQIDFRSLAMGQPTPAAFTAPYTTGVIAAALVYPLVAAFEGQTAADERALNRK